MTTQTRALDQDKDFYFSAFSISLLLGSSYVPPHAPFATAFDSSFKMKLAIIITLSTLT
jgi:hypothetical protein